MIAAVVDWGVAQAMSMNNLALTLHACQHHAGLTARAVNGCCTTKTKVYVVDKLSHNVLHTCRLFTLGGAF
jgi:hypothetical protein